MAGPDPDRIDALIPLDGSPRAEVALQFASAFTPVGPVSAHLVAVVDDTKDHTPEWLVSQHNLLEAYLHQKAAYFPDGVEGGEVVITNGAPAACILETAQRLNVDVVVISSHSRSGIQRWRLGSVADKVVRGSVCDTLVIGGEVHAAKPAIRKILVPLDGSPLAEQALTQAQRLASRLGAEMHLVRVVSSVSLASGTDPTGLGYTSANIYEAIIEEAETYIAQMKEKTAAAGAKAFVGVPAESLIGYAEDNAIDLVVMTTHGRGGVARTALGSVTDRLLGGPTPVWVVRGH
jgi:nucleotide-binding universal stress UspA family protein